jgi:hypothetical protein
MDRDDETGKVQSDEGVREPIQGESPAGPSDADDRPVGEPPGANPADEDVVEELDKVDEWGVESFPASDPPAP